MSSLYNKQVVFIVTIINLSFICKRGLEVDLTKPYIVSPVLNNDQNMQHIKLEQKIRKQNMFLMNYYKLDVVKQSQVEKHRISISTVGDEHL